MTAPMRFDPRVSFFLGTQWVDVTTSVRQTRPIRISRGLKPESTKLLPQKCDLVLNDPSGDFTPGDPMSRYYGLLGRNTPIDVKVMNDSDTFDRTDLGSTETKRLMWKDQGEAGTTSSISSKALRHTISTASASARTYAVGETWLDHEIYFDFNMPFSPTGDYAEVAAVFRATDGAASRCKAVVRKWNTFTPGTFQLRIETPTGASAFVNSPAFPGVFDTTWWSVRARIEQETVRIRVWDRSTPEPRDWTMTAHLGVSSGLPSTAGVVGLESRVGSLSTGLPRSISFDNYSTAHPRFYGEISEMTPSTEDNAGRTRLVQVTAAGISRRLGQGQSPRESALRRALVKSSDIIGYWACEDPPYALTGAGTFPGGLKPSLVPFNVIKFGAVDDFFGSAPITDTQKTSLFFEMPDYEPPLVNRMELSCVYRSDLPGVGLNAVIMTASMIGGNITQPVLYIQNSGNVMIDVYGNSGLIASTGPWFVWSPVAKYRLIMSLEQSGVDTILKLQWVTEHDEGGLQVGAASQVTLSGINMGKLSLCWMGDGQDFNAGMGHVMARTAIQGSPFTLGWDFSGYFNEKALDRMIRIGAEEGSTFTEHTVPFEYRGRPDKTIHMGIQGSNNTVLQQYQDAADVDFGIITEPRGGPGLHYTARHILYSADPVVTLDYTHLNVPLRPVTDDRYTRNEVLGRRTMGGEYTLRKSTGPMSTRTPPNGAGRYDVQISVNCARRQATGTVAPYEGLLPDVVGWALNLGTVAEPRFPDLSVNLTSPTLTDAVRRGLMDLQPGHRLDVMGGLKALGVYGVQRMLLFGYAEKISRVGWEIDLNAAPYAGTDVLKLDAGTTHHRLQPTSAVLASGVTSGATSLTITSAETWVTTATHPTAFPLDAMIGGELLSVTGITGASPTWTFTVARSQNGVVKSHAAGAALTLPRPFKIGL